jgi:hypothetical protein
VPGFPGTDLVLVEANLTLAGLEAFLHAPAGSGDADKGLEADPGG